MHNNAASKLKMFSRNFNEERVMSFTLAMPIQFPWMVHPVHMEVSSVVPSYQGC